MDALDWKPRPFTEEELADIDPVIRAYLKDVDVTMLIANRRLSYEQRIRNAEAHARQACELANQARRKWKN